MFSSNVTPSPSPTVHAKLTELHGKRVFVGVDAVDWIEEHLKVSSRPQSLAICQTLLGAGIVRLMNGTASVEFADDATMYEFVLLDGEKGGAAKVRPPPSRLPAVREKRQYSIVEFDALEVARQVSLVDRDLFLPIVPSTLEVMPNQQLDLSDAGAAFIRRFNATSHWVATEIVILQRLEERCARIQLFIRIADELEKLRNYHSMFAVVGGLHLSSVNRLKKTWKLVKTKPEFLLLRRLVILTTPARNYTAYRYDRSTLGVVVFHFALCNPLTISHNPF